MRIIITNDTYIKFKDFKIVCPWRDDEVGMHFTLKGRKWYTKNTCLATHLKCKVSNCTPFLLQEEVI